MICPVSGLIECRRETWGREVPLKDRRSRMHRCDRVISLVAVVVFLGGLFWTSTAMAFEVGNSKWPTASTLFNVNFQGENATLWNSAFEEAMDKWNSATVFQFNMVLGTSVDPCQDPNDFVPGNGAKFDSTTCDDAWGAGVLAVELGWFSNNETVQSGIIFNSNVDWDVYSGPLEQPGYFGIIDFRRVAVHELGHTIGLNHEDDVRSIMGTYISDYEDPQPDDIAGVAFLYEGVSSGGICSSRKIRAAGTLVMGLLKCYSRETGYPAYSDLSSCVDDSESKFESAWATAEARAARQGEDCTSAGALAIADVIMAAVEDIYSQISSGLDLGDRNARRLGSALLRYAGDLGKNLFQAESRYARNPDYGVLTKKNKAVQRFRNRWARRLSRADNQGVVYILPSTEDVETMIEALVEDICSDI